MKIINILGPLFAFTVFFVLFSTIGCRHADKNKVRNARYAFYVLAKDGKEYLLTSNSLDSGNLQPEKQGVLLDQKDMDRDLLVKDGFYYHLNRKTKRFSKFRIIEGKLAVENFIEIDDFSIENFNWIGKDSLLLCGLNISGYNQAKYVLINTLDMKKISDGKMAIPPPSGKFTTLSIGFVKRSENALLVGYTYHINQSASNYLTSDTLYVSKLTYPGMECISTQKDTRSTYPGGINTIQSYSFQDVKGDYYFQSCPGIALGNRPEIPSGIFKLKAGTDKIDPDYFFDISNSIIKNHAYGMWYLGNNSVIIRCERKDLFKGWGDHYSTAHFEFYVLDLVSKAVSKLNLPLDKGTRRECVIVEGDKAYIAVNSTKEGNYIWIYDLSTGVLKKGLQLSGDTDFILRIDRLEAY